jgi:hypothetical protein
VLRLPAPPTAGSTSGHSSHFTRECTTPKKNATQGHITHPPHVLQKVVVAKTGHIKCTTMEDITDSEQVLVDTFSLNRYHVVILFDSGATHDFISKACIQKSLLAIQHMSTPYLIKTPGGKISTNQLLKNNTLNLGGKEYKTCLIVLEDQGIDIILGMGWMKVHQALLDTATRVVHLDSPIYGIHVLQLSSPSATNPSIHHTTAQSLANIPVACKFPDVFPEDLPDMPLDRDVEFIIEL